jgi:prophage regulatory protein
VAETILRRPQVEKCTGKGRSAIYQEIAAGTFPAPIKIGPKAVGWLESEIIAWQKARIAERDQRASERQAA